MISLRKPHYLRHLSLIIFTIPILTLFTGCQDFGAPATKPAPVDSVGLTIMLVDFLPHIDKYMELNVISDSNVLVTKIILNPLEATQLTIEIPGGLPAGNNRLDLFCDLNGNKIYDSVPADHSWRTDLPPFGLHLLTHDDPFTDLRIPGTTERGGKFSINLSGFASHIGKLFEVRVIELLSGATVGIHRLPLIPDSSFVVSINGIIESGSDYQIDFYSDNNFNFKYDPPPLDLSWRFFGTGSDSGMILDFVFDSNFTDIGL